MAFYRFLVDWLLPRLAVAFLAAVSLYAAVYRWVVPPVVWSQYLAEVQLHVLKAPPVDEGAGSEDIAYLTMAYDCRAGDIVVEGVAPDAPYWQIGIYDRYVRALPGGHLNHRTVDRTDDGTRFSVRITQTPAGRPNTLDCSRSTRGMFIYRVVLPDGPIETPTVRVGG